MNTFDQVKETVIDTLNFDGDITEQSDFTKDLEADSLDIVELMMALEEKFGIQIPDEEVQNLHTIGDVVKYIDAHKEA